MWSVKSRTRRLEIRKKLPGPSRFDWQKLQADGTLTSVGIAAAFFLIATTILMWRQDVVPYRPDQWVPHDIHSRVAFSYKDPRKAADEEREAYAREPRVYRENGDVLGDLHKALLDLPGRIASSPAQD